MGKDVSLSMILLFTLV